MVLSDMKQATSTLNLECQTPSRTVSVLRQVGDVEPLANLIEVHVYLEGADGAGESVARWMKYENSGSRISSDQVLCVESYSVLRETQGLSTKLITDGIRGN